MSLIKEYHSMFAVLHMVHEATQSSRVSQRFTMHTWPTSMLQYFCTNNATVTDIFNLRSNRQNRAT